MEETKLDVQIREEIGSRLVKRLRDNELLPAIVYGAKKKPTAIRVDKRTFERIRRQHHGEVVFHLNVFQGDKKLRDYSAIVKEEQHDPVTDEILHIDFKRISLTEEIEVQVSVSAKGEPVGVKRDGGSLEHAIWELDIICLPMSIPEEIVVDVSAMEIGDSIHVKDISLPQGVKTKHDPEAVVLTVAPPQKEEEETAEGEEEAGEPEVISEKKDKDEENEQGGAEKAEKKEEPKDEK